MLLPVRTNHARRTGTELPEVPLVTAVIHESVLHPCLLSLIGSRTPARAGSLISCTMMANSAPVGYDCAVPFSTSRAPHGTLVRYARAHCLVAAPLVAALLVVAGRLPAQAVPADSGARAARIIR